MQEFARKQEHGSCKRTPMHLQALSATLHDQPQLLCASQHGRVGMHWSLKLLEWECLMQISTAMCEQDAHAACSLPCQWKGGLADLSAG